MTVIYFGEARKAVDEKQQQMELNDIWDRMVKSGQIRVPDEAETFLFQRLRDLVFMSLVEQGRVLPGPYSTELGVARVQGLCRDISLDDFLSYDQEDLIKLAGEIVDNVPPSVGYLRYIQTSGSTKVTDDSGETRYKLTFLWRAHEPLTPDVT